MPDSQSKSPPSGTHIFDRRDLSWSNSLHTSTSPTAARPLRAKQGEHYEETILRSVLMLTHMKKLCQATAWKYLQQYLVVIVVGVLATSTMLSI